MKIIIFEGIDVEQMKQIRNSLREDGFVLTNKRPGVIELTDTERIKLGNLETERPVERDLSEDKIKPETLKKFAKQLKKPQKVRNSHIPRKQVRYTPEIVERVREVANEKSNQEIADMLREEFGINVLKASVANMMWTRSIRRSKTKANPEPKQVEKPIQIETPEMKRKEELAANKRKGMSKEVVEVIRDNYMEMTDEELREEIGDKFGAFFQVDKIKAYRESNGMARPEGWNPDDFKDTEEEL